MLIRGKGRKPVSDYPSVDESFGCLHRAGWSVGAVATAAGWCANGTNGENRIEGRGSTQAAAWGRDKSPAETDVSRFIRADALSLSPTLGTAESLFVQ